MVPDHEVGQPVIFPSGEVGVIVSIVENEVIVVEMMDGESKGKFRVLPAEDMKWSPTN